ncbi:hypothetical protein ACFWPD_27615 [Streptomyces bauhiniae]|uniref:hypothetical protein n=1 Tax=Streptomyces bauhiniae TaxID=2340725 RepID=UPI00365FBCCB
MVLLLAMLAGGTAGALTRAAGESPARSILAGLAADAAAVVFFNGLIAAEYPALERAADAGGEAGDRG